MPETLVMISHPMIASLEGRLAGEGFAVRRAWDLDEADRAGVRAIFHAGEIVLTPEFLLSLPNLGLIAAMTAGYDGVDVGWCRAHGIEVTNAQGVNADDVADHALGLLIAGWRELGDQHRIVTEGRWVMTERLAPVPTLTGKRLGIVGLGHIGLAVGRRAEACRMRVSWWGPNPKPAPWPRSDTLLDLAAESDILMVACRGGADTRGLVTREVIEAVGPEGMIVNVSRGSVIDEDALIAALKGGKLRRAALDVFAVEPTPAERWVDVPGVFLTPHRAGGTTEGIPNMAAQAVENIRRFFEGRPLLSPVPAPRSPPAS